MDKLTAGTPCYNCKKGNTSPGGSTTCSTGAFTWMYNCSSLTGTELKQCHKCNRQLIFDHILDLTTLIIPFGATYGEWLGGVTDPDLNALIKAFTGTFLVDMVLNVTSHKQQALNHALIDSLAVGGWVLAAQIIQDYVFHGSPNRVIAAGVAGLANYYRTVGHLPITVDNQEVGGALIFATLMSGFAGNWSMMGDNLLSRFMSTTFAGFFAFFGSMSGDYASCIINAGVPNKKNPDRTPIFPKEAFMAALQLGIGSSMMGIIVDSALGKPVISGLAAGATGLYIAKTIFDNDTFKVCGKTIK